MHRSRAEKVPTESQGDEVPIIHSVQAPSAETDVARASRQQSGATENRLLYHLIRPLQE